MTVFEKSYAAFLFDMDGTLLSSIAAAERVWSAWAERHGIDVAAFLPTIHGVRAADTITTSVICDSLRMRRPLRPRIVVENLRTFERSDPSAGQVRSCT